MSVEKYQQSLRPAVRGLWSGALDFDQYFDAMMSAIQRGITQAWNAGAREAGITPDELTPEERVAREQTIASEFNYIAGLGERIEENSRENGGKLSTVYNLLGAWVNRWRDAKNRAMETANNDPKLMWNLGIAEHCSSCVRLDKKVKRASFWDSRDVHPQQPPNEKLECGGWECKCFFTVTNEPLSRGPLPKLP